MPSSKNKKDELPKNPPGLKYKKDSLPKTAIANPFIIKLKIARNTNKKAKVHDPNINNNSPNEEVKPFEMVFARMEKRRMGLKKKTINSPNIKNKKKKYKNVMMTMMKMKLTMMKSMMMTMTTTMTVIMKIAMMS